MFDCRLVCELLASMNDSELDELKSSDLYRRSPVLSRALDSCSKNSPVEKSLVMELHKIPEEQISMWNISVHVLL